MAKIKKAEKSQLYGLMEQRASELKEHNDCAVKAIAAACDVSYEQAHQALRTVGRKDRHCTETIVIWNAVQLLGYKCERIPSCHFIDQYPGTHKNIKHVTSHHPVRFPRVWQDRYKYLMLVDSHILAICDGQVHDWSINRAKRAQKIWRVTKA